MGERGARARENANAREKSQDAREIYREEGENSTT